VYNNGLVVIIWEHRRLPELAAALGWPAMPAIADDDFDHLDHLIYRPSSRRPVLHRYSQRALLAGSQPCTRASDL
jgi:hypothetical protein